MTNRIWVFSKKCIKYYFYLYYYDHNNNWIIITTAMTEEADIEPLLTISNSPCDGENQHHKSKIRGFRWLKTHEDYKNILLLF